MYSDGDHIEYPCFPVKWLALDSLFSSALDLLLKYYGAGVIDQFICFCQITVARGLV